MTTAEDDAIGDDYVIAVFTAERSPLSVGSVDRLLARSGALACYVTATENPAVLRAGWHASTLSDAARGALRSLDAAPLTLLSLGTFLTRSATTVVNQLRRDAGGTVADRVRFDDDPVLDALCWFARDYAPLYLSARLERGGNVEVLVWPPGPTHPAVTALSAAVRTDPVLGPACGEDELGVRFRVGPTSPFAYAHQQLVPLEQLGFSLLADAATDVYLARPDTVTIDALTAATVTVLERLRRLVAGGTLQVTARHGLAGISLPSPIALTDGELRPLNDHDRHANPEEPDHPDALRRRVPTETVFAQLVTITAEPAPDFAPEQAVPRHDTLHPLGRVRLAIVLATAQLGTPTTARVVWSTLPRLRWAGGHTLYPPTPPTVPYSIGLTTSDLTAIATWDQHIAAHHHVSLELVVRRLLRAVTERDEPDDALVDAVIALEALLAAGDSNEITHRVALAVAWLLYPHQSDERDTTYKQVKTIYSYRSRIVHGKHKTIATTTLIAQRDQAINLVARCLAVLYRDRTDLITNPNRSLALQLQSAGPTTHP